jgi:hypothetical protein
MLKAKRLLSSNKYLLLVAAFLLAVLVMLPGLFFSRLKVTDGFLYQIIAYIQLTLDDSHLVPLIKDGYSFNFIEFLPGYPLILSLLSRLGSIPPVQLQFIPIAALFIPFGYFVISWKLFKSKLLSALFALYGAYDIGLASNYNVFAFTWSNLLYFGFLLIYIRMIKSRRLSDIIVTFVLFFASFFLHYAASMWMIANAVFLNGVLYLRPFISKFYKIELKGKGSIAMPLAFVITFLGFNQVFYKVWLPSARNILFNSAYPLDFISTKFLSYLYTNNSINQEPFRFLNPWGQSFGQWRIVEYLVILLPIFILITRFLVGLLFNKPMRIQSTNLLFFIPLFLTAIVDLIIYGSYSGINFRYVSLVFPFLSVISISSLFSNQILQKIYLVILVFTAAMTFSFAYKYYDEFPPTSYEHAANVSNWIFENSMNGPGLSDLDTQGIITVLASERNEVIPSIKVYDNNLYGSLLNPNLEMNTSREYNIIIAESLGQLKPIHGISNKLFEPLAFHKEKISSNNLLDMIYDDGLYSIYIRAKAEQK